jgi:hypothetical protein
MVEFGLERLAAAQRSVLEQLEDYLAVQDRELLFKAACAHNSGGQHSDRPKYQHARQGRHTSSGRFMCQRANVTGLTERVSFWTATSTTLDQLIRLIADV